MTTVPTSPREQEKQAEHRAATDPIYRALLQTLHTCARADLTLPTAAAMMALIDLAGDLAISSGLVWTSPDIISSLQSMSDTLERRRDAGPPASAQEHATLEGWFAAARAPIMH